ncbi:hypothetical protein BHE74_00017793 [Ensete ventricosum]|nr:hypothetical protein BHE74_00017793 [Ensete ventricosum]
MPARAGQGKSQQESTFLLPDVRSPTSLDYLANLHTELPLGGWVSPASESWARTSFKRHLLLLCKRKESESNKIEGRAAEEKTGEGE